MERVSEALFGLIMVLTFTGSLSVLGAGRSEVREMLAAALGCNIAWGVIDGVFYLMGRYSERSREALALSAIRAAPDPGRAHALIADALPESVASALRPEDLEILRLRIKGNEEARRARITKSDWLGAMAVFLWVVVSVLPVIVPFVVTSDARLALRASNGIAIVMLFLLGWAFGGYAGRPPWRVGLWMVLAGGILVGLTIALGG